jgi:choline dehydrogenase
MAYHRSTKGSYQAWADQVEDQSFTFDNLLPYFKKSVIFTKPNLALRGGPPVAYDPAPFSSTGGPLHVSFWNYFIPASSVISQGLRKLGFNETSQIQSGSLLGFAQFPATLTPDTQIRDSSQTSFLDAAIAADSSCNLQLYPNTLAKQILFDSTKTATGVRVNTAGWEYVLSARKEVILAAGVFRTPQLLMVSGVGPSATLTKNQIPILSALEGVGKNMQVRK